VCASAATTDGAASAARTSNPPARASLTKCLLVAALMEARV
jgi:hypothetical protein